eukprot:CAMPEP_0178410832 /NCGR_PEP_ID=MMETSP0689_2-20121128/21187_1 /TAXON_ID=160604 /ORGANISM="Amphidinium massartii, Strain CS-259" /LENGTH=442 /DNA_ID=CAMNT_0020032029 /DNA_START=245 /DNA_END=1570 /DNA_ORIENTATION=+
MASSRALGRVGFTVVPVDATAPSMPSLGVSGSAAPVSTIRTPRGQCSGVLSKLWGRELNHLNPRNLAGLAIAAAPGFIVLAMAGGRRKRGARARRAQIRCRASGQLSHQHTHGSLRPQTRVTEAEEESALRQLLLAAAGQRYLASPPGMSWLSDFLPASVTHVEPAQELDLSHPHYPLLSKLQGRWEDNADLTIKVAGSVANFKDGTGAWDIIEDGNYLTLRGARLMQGRVEAGDVVNQLTWLFDNGVVWVWNRLDSETPEEQAWSDLVLRYKEARLRLRRALWAAVVHEDFSEAVELQAAWLRGSCLPPEASIEQQVRLTAGRYIIPGTCFRHRRSGGFGVILGCEPLGRGRTHENDERREERRRQPTYHCLMLSDGDADGSAGICIEEDVEVCPEAFATLEEMKTDLLVRCEEVRAYLPTPALEKALQEQRKTARPLVIW